MAAIDALQKVLLLLASIPRDILHRAPNPDSQCLVPGNVAADCLRLHCSSSPPKEPPKMSGVLNHYLHSLLLCIILFVAVALSQEVTTTDA